MICAFFCCFIILNEIVASILYVLSNLATAAMEHAWVGSFYFLVTSHYPVLLVY